MGNEKQALKNLNLVSFSGLGHIESLSKEFRDEAVVIAKDFSPEELKKFAEERKGFATNFFSCKVFSKKDDSGLQKFRKLADTAAIYSGSLEMNAWASRQKNVLVLQPFSADKNCLDLATANNFRDNSIVSCFLFSEFLAEKNSARAPFLLKNAALALKLLEKAQAPVLFVSGARSANEMRASKDLASFPALLGAKREQIAPLSAKALELLSGALK
ncbi:MAG TPA: hypothetical protein VFF09_01035 [archaeon]|nr:hypothetical protein [archaeon]